MTTVAAYFLIPPDWQKGVSFKKKWFTTIQTSLDKTEKRSALYTWPRRALFYEASALSYTDSMYLKGVLYKNLHSIWGVPFWQDGTGLSADAAVAQKILQVGSTKYRNFEVGAECIIFSSRDSYEIGVIDSFTDTAITLVDNLASTWVKNVFVYPILKGRLQVQQKVKATTATITSLRLQIKEEYDVITRYSADLSAFDYYNIYPVFDLFPNWDKMVEFDLLHDYSLLQFLGLSTSFTHQEETEFKYKANYLINTKENIQKAVDFFDYHKGMLGVFWKPNWEIDIQVTSPFLSTDRVLDVTDIDFNEYWLDVHRYAIFIWPDDSFVCGKIISATDDTITLQSDIGKACTEAQLNQLKVSFLMMSRFSQDELEIKYISANVVDLTLNFQTVFKETPIITTTTTTTTTSSSTTSSSTTSSSSTTTTTS